MANKTKICKKILAIMKDVEYVQKDGKNKFQNYNYVSEANISEKVRQSMVTNGIIAVPNVANISVIPAGKTNSGAEQRLTTVDLITEWIDSESGESITVSMSGQGIDTGDKGVYKAITGANKYTLMKMFQIATGDDPEKEEEQPKQQEKQPTEKPTQTNESMSEIREKVNSGLKWMLDNGVKSNDQIRDAIQTYVEGDIDKCKFPHKLIKFRTEYIVPIYTNAKNIVKLDPPDLADNIKALEKECDNLGVFNAPKHKKNARLQYFDKDTQPDAFNDKKGLVGYQYYLDEKLKLHKNRKAS